MRFLDLETAKGLLQMVYVAVLVIVDITWLVNVFSDTSWSKSKCLCVVVNAIVFLGVSLWLWL